METELMTAEQIITQYRTDIEKLAAYLPWLETKSGQSTSNTYGQDGISKNSLAFPVYDSNLLRFVKDAKETQFMDPNYRYIYSRYRIRGYADELKVIHQTTILQMNILGGILSKYVLGGQTKAKLWSDGVCDCIFLETVKKAKELIDYWDTTRK